tara:strand:+ start:169 stop:294 length:126 start_codon:yes stop_codon:yes gene_type:complete
MTIEPNQDQLANPLPAQARLQAKAGNEKYRATVRGFLVYDH